MMKSLLLPGLTLAWLAAVPYAHADLIGRDSFRYPDGPLGSASGGTFFDWNNGTQSHTGTASDWNSVGGAPVVVGHALVTDSSSTKREFNGPFEGVPPSHEGDGALTGTGVVYFRVQVTHDATATWSGVSSHEFATERIFFGVLRVSGPSGQPEFGIQDLDTPGPAGRSYSGINPVAGQSYVLVGKLDFDGDLLSLYLDPDLSQPEGESAPVATQRYNGTAWSSAVRLASGGKATWDKLEVATGWRDLTAGDPESAPFLADTRNYEDSTPPFTANTVAPDVIVNTGIGDPGGTNFTITMAMLQVTGGPSGTDAITFTLVSAPVHGTLRLNGSPLAPGAMFTHADVDGGLLEYERAAGAALTDSFELGAVDQAGNNLAEGSFHFAVSGIPGDSGMLFVADSRNARDSAIHTVHTDACAYLPADPIPGSLRQALSNTDPSGTTTLDAALNAQTILLNSGPLVVDKALTIDDSATPGGLTLSGNQDSAVLHLTDGGVLALEGMTLTDGKSTASGGAIVNQGDLTLTNVTIANSLSFLDGGGIFNLGTLSLSNVTITGNLAADLGGGIFNAGTLTAIHSTIADNEAFFLAGGGIYQGAGTVSLENSVVAGNVAAIDDNLNGAPDSATGNNLLSGDPRLAPLGDYGGRTSTMPPLPGSPVIEGAVRLGSTPPTDQLGNARPSGPLPDLGAVEAVPFAPLALEDSEPDGIPDVLEPAFAQFTIGVDDSALDSDGDGRTDAQELADMTDPLNNGDFFRILSHGPAAGFDAQTNPLVTVTISTFPGLEYEFETDGTLQDLQPLVPDSTFTANDFSATFEVLFDPGVRNFVRAVRK